MAVDYVTFTSIFDQLLKGWPVSVFAAALVNEGLIKFDVD
jgi:hypothetical protein